MKVIEKECHVPAKTYIDKTYVAFDGTEFCQEKDCLKYENTLKIKNHPIYTTAIRDVDKFYDGNVAALYYISSKDDYDFFKESQDIDVEKEHYFISDFNKYGAGWYLYYIEDECYGPDYKYLKNYDAYEKMLESELEEYKTRMRNLINNA